MTAANLGTAASASVALVAIGMSVWIIRHYLATLRATGRRSGLLPLHVMSVAAWSIAALLRMIARDQYPDRPPPGWLGWPLTLVLAVWLVAGLYLIVLHYGGRGRPRARHLGDRPPSA